MDNYDPLLTMAALNTAIVSLHRITSTRDRLILDQEYTCIINNLQIGEIKPDPELTSLYQKIIHVINAGRLRDEVKKSVEATYIQTKQKGIKDIISENVLSSFDSSPLKWIGNLAMTCVSEYFGSKKQDDKQDDEQLKLKSEELSEYDELQRKLLDSSWKLLRQYQLADNYRLTQNALDKFYAATQENDSSKRLRMLKYLENDFSMYSPYWFYRAMAAHESGNHNEAEKSFAKFNEVWRPVLRKDPYKVEALKFQIEALMNAGLDAENVGKILECLSEMKANTPMDDWKNNIYEGTLYFTLGDKEKAIECVMCNVVWRYEKDISQRLLEKFTQERSLIELPAIDEKLAKKDKKIFYCTDRGARATCFVTDADKFRVTRGSQLSPKEITQSCPQNVKKFLEEYDSEIVDGVLLVDVDFKSPSAAASFVTKMSIDGKSAWKTANGIAYSSFLEKNVLTE
ncbi:MAG: DUF4357 domain-containing protein [Synergistaceae bacterium]|nr:DUF4357 domain-containing protein [Synergistaceae bacterium]